MKLNIKILIVIIILSSLLSIPCYSSKSKLVTQKGCCKLKIISTEPNSPAQLKAGQKAYVNFKYNMGEYDSVQIWVMPRTNGSDNKRGVYHCSPVYNKYDGSKDTIKGYFLFNESAEVDEVIIRMKDVKSGEYVCVAKKKVDLKWHSHNKEEPTEETESTETATYIIEFTPILPHNPRTARELLREFNRNHSLRVRTHHYRTKVSGNKLSGFICTDNPGDMKALTEMLKHNKQLELTSVRVATQQEFEEHRRLGQPSLPTPENEQENRLEILSTVPASPAVLNAGDKFYVNFRYTLGSSENVQIWARPQTNGRRTPGYAAHGSGGYNKKEKVTGIDQGYFFFDKPTKVDEILVYMKDIKSGKTVCSVKKKVDLKWIDYSKPKDMKTSKIQPKCSSGKCSVSSSPKKAEVKSSNPGCTIEIHRSGEFDNNIFDEIKKAHDNLFKSGKNKGALIYRVRSEDGQLGRKRYNHSRTEFHWTGRGRSGYKSGSINEGEITVVYEVQGQPAELRVSHPDYHEFKRPIIFEKQKMIVWDDIVLNRVTDETSCTIKGTVQLEDDVNPNGILVSSGNTSTFVDKEGDFVLKGLRSGEVRINARRPGYFGLFGRVNITKGETKQFNLKGYRIRKAKVKWVYQPDGSKNFTNENVIEGTAIIEDNALDRISFSEGFSQVCRESDFLLYQSKNNLYIKNFDVCGSNGPAIFEANNTLDKLKEAPNFNYTDNTHTLKVGKVFVFRCYDGEHYAKMEVLDIIGD